MADARVEVDCFVAYFLSSFLSSTPYLSIRLDRHHAAALQTCL
jgi:hypothetical protein